MLRMREKRKNTRKDTNNSYDNSWAERSFVLAEYAVLHDNSSLRFAGRLRICPFDFHLCYFVPSGFKAS
jgi:hypothetical protein